MTNELLQKVVRSAVQAEREACAKVTQSFYLTPERTDTAKAIARAIRERGVGVRIYNVSAKGVPQDYFSESIYPKTYPEQKDIDEWFKQLPVDLSGYRDSVICVCGEILDVTFVGAFTTRVKDWKREHFPHQFILDPVNPMDLSFVTEC